MKAEVMPDGHLILPVALLERHGLMHGGQVVVEDRGDAIILRTLDNLVADAQAISRRLVAGREGSSVDHFLADRSRDAE